MEKELDPNARSQEAILANELYERLKDAIYDFVKEKHEISSKVALAAINWQLAKMLTAAPSKAQAYGTLDACFRMIRNMINETPDAEFGVN